MGGQGLGTWSSKPGSRGSEGRGGGLLQAEESEGERLSQGFQSGQDTVEWMGPLKTQKGAGADLGPGAQGQRTRGLGG